jgi:hypothetical protein
LSLVDSLTNFLTILLGIPFWSHFAITRTIAAQNTANH